MGVSGQLPAEPDDLAEFERILLARKVSRVALTHFDMAKHRHDYYGIDLFASLRYLIMDERKLVLLVQSRTSFDTLLPHDYPLSSSPIDIKTVDLWSKP